MHRLNKGSFTFEDASGKDLVTRRRGDDPPVVLTELAILEALQGATLTAAQAAQLWSFFGNLDNISLLTLPIVKALAAASSAAPTAREPMWSELSALARALPRRDPARLRDRSLLGLFENNRSIILALLPEQPETEGGANEMIELMLASRVFAPDLLDSVAYVSERIPAAVALRIERDREKGRRQPWEYTAYEAMLRWKKARLLPGGAKAPRTLAELDAAGAQFVTIFNCLHALDIGYREVILRGLGPVEIYNAVVAGERELYRLGTSGYRGYLHAIIMRGIKESGSFEAFLDRAVPRQLGGEAIRASTRRGMVFLRIAASFGLLDQVLETVRDREAFVAAVIAALDDPLDMEANSTVVIEVVTGVSVSPAAQSFKTALIERLYERYGAAPVPAAGPAPGPALRNVYGSMLSVYQTVTGNRRIPAIDREFALDDSMFRIPFERLFTNDGHGWRHRMIMRMDENLDAAGSHKTFRVLMRALRATLRKEPHFEVYTLWGNGRRIEIYVNQPSSNGIREGLDDIAEALAGARVETVIGRGHTSIIAPLQADAKRMLGDRVRDVALVLVGSCGGDASIRELIATFGHIPFFTTKSTGRQVINNAIIKTYIGALLSLKQGERLAMTDVLDNAVARFLRPGVDADLRTDADLYQLNMATVLSAQLFDTHVRSPPNAHRHATRE